MSLVWSLCIFGFFSRNIASIIPHRACDITSDTKAHEKLQEFVVSVRLVTGYERSNLVRMVSTVIIN